MRQIKELIIHCTDSCDSLDIGFTEINSWHKDRGWLSPSGISCGYHFIVRRSGTIEAGRPAEEMGAHVRGHNRESLGIVWVGRTNPSSNQLLALLALTRGLMETFDVDVDKVLGHCELYSGKTCPNLDMNKFRAELLFTKGESNA